MTATSESKHGRGSEDSSATRRITFRADGDIAELLEFLVEEEIYPNRSAAIRDLIRRGGVAKLETVAEDPASKYGMAPDQER